MPQDPLYVPEVGINGSNLQHQASARPDYSLTASRSSRNFDPLLKLAGEITRLQQEQAIDEADARSLKRNNEMQLNGNAYLSEMQTKKSEDGINFARTAPKVADEIIRTQEQTLKGATPREVQAFKEASENFKTSLLSKAEGYAMQETFNFNNQEMKAAIDLTTNEVISNWDNPYLRAKGLEQLKNQVGAMADYNGVNPDSEAYKVALQQATDSVYVTAIEDKINLEKFGEARGALNEAWKNKDITAASRNDLVARLFNAEQSAHTRALANRAYRAQINAAYRQLEGANLDAFLQNQKQIYLANENNHYETIDSVERLPIQEQLKLGASHVVKGGSAKTAPLFKITQKVVRKTPEKLNSDAESFAAQQALLYDGTRLKYKSTDGYMTSRMIQNGLAFAAQNGGRIDNPRQMFPNEQEYRAAITYDLERGGDGRTWLANTAKFINNFGDFPNEKKEQEFYTIKENLPLFKAKFKTQTDFDAWALGKVSNQQYDKMNKDLHGVWADQNKTSFKDYFTPKRLAVDVEKFGIDLNKDGRGDPVNERKYSEFIAHLEPYIAKKAQESGINMPTSSDYAFWQTSFSTDPIEVKSLYEDLHRIERQAEAFEEVDIEQTEENKELWMSYLKVHGYNPSQYDFQTFVQEAQTNPIIRDRLNLPPQSQAIMNFYNVR